MMIIKNMIIKKSSLCILIAVLLFSVTVMMSCGKKADVKVEEWRIPTIFFLSGPMAGFAAPHKWMAEEVVKEMNESGGIAGKRVVLEFLDSGFDPTKATAVMAKAIDSGALLINGPLSDMEMKACMPLAVKAGIFCFSGTCTTSIAKEFFPWTVFSLPATNETLKYQMEMWLKHEKDIKSAAALEEPLYPMIRTLNSGFLKSLESHGVKSHGIIEAPSGMADYTPIVVRALGSGAKAFIIGATEEVAAKLVNGLVSRGQDPSKIYIMSGFVGPTFLSEAKKNCEGVYSATSPTYASTEQFKKLSKLYKDTHDGRPWGGLTVATYDMLYLIKAAIEGTGVTGDPAKLEEERTKIKDYAINVKGFKGIDATYDIVNGLAVGYPQRLFQVKNNEAVLVDEVKP